jgi:predicted amidohydrolase
VAAVALDAAYSAVELVDQLRTLVRTLAAQGVRLVVLPDLAGEDARAVSQQELLPLIEALSTETATMLAVTVAERTPAATYKSITLIDRGVLLAAHRQSHLSPRELAAGFTAGDAAPPLVACAVGNIGLLSASEGLVPELARGLKLRGAEVLAWSAGDVGGTGAPLRTIARVRANEERAYVVAAGDTSAAGGGYVVDPTGTVIGETLSGRAMAMSADIHRMLTRWNDMAPGTNPVRDRHPETFRSLFAPEPVAGVPTETRA